MGRSVLHISKSMDFPWLCEFTGGKVLLLRRLPEENQAFVDHFPVETTGFSTCFLFVYLGWSAIKLQDLLTAGFGFESWG